MTKIMAVALCLLLLGCGTGGEADEGKTTTEAGGTAATDTAVADIAPVDTGAPDVGPEDT